MWALHQKSRPTNQIHDRHFVQSTFMSVCQRSLEVSGKTPSPSWRLVGVTCIWWQSEPNPSILLNDHVYIHRHMSQESLSIIIIIIIIIILIVIVIVIVIIIIITTIITITTIFLETKNPFIFHPPQPNHHFPTYHQTPQTPPRSGKKLPAIAAPLKHDPQQSAPLPAPPEIAGLMIRAYEPLVSLNKASLNLYFWGG